MRPQDLRLTQHVREQMAARPRQVRGPAPVAHPPHFGKAELAGAARMARTSCY